MNAIAGESPALSLAVSDGLRDLAITLIENWADLGSMSEMRMWVLKKSVIVYLFPP